MAEWLVYAVVVSSLVSVAAWLAERGARAERWPTRWIWAGALALSVAAPALARLMPRTGPAEAPLAAVPGDYLIQTIPLGAAAGGSSGGPGLETLLVAGWVGASLLLLLGLVSLAVRLELRRRRWPRRVVDGVEVLVSRRTGPAAIGVLRGRVVVPAWALGLEPAQRRLLVLHEAEHVRRGDPRLAMAGLLACVLAPWNLPLWWQLRRLRLAIEVDCDARVLRRCDEPRAYGALLLAVGQRKAYLALALAESPGLLERRIRMITENGKGRAWVRGGLLLALSGVVLALACETPGPTAPAEPAPRPAPTEAPPELEAPPGLEAPPAPSEAPSLDEIADGPTFTPMTARPELRNPDAVQRALMEHYPPLLRDAGIGGTVSVWFLLDEEGRVVDRRINTSSGRSALDLAAIEVADVMEFTPGYNRDKPVPVWIALSIRFDAEEDAELRRPTARGEEIPRTPEEREEIRRALAESFERMRQEMSDSREPAGEPLRPTFTPMTERPQVTNQQEVMAALQEHYPPLLRDAGIGGTATVWFYIDETGVVRDVRINESSGHESLDQAALHVGRVMRFTPARNRDEVVPVWVSLAITFESG